MTEQHIQRLLDKYDAPYIQGEQINNERYNRERTKKQVLSRRRTAYYEVVSPLNLDKQTKKDILYWTEKIPNLNSLLPAKPLKKIISGIIMIIDFEKGYDEDLDKNPLWITYKWNYNEFTSFTIRFYNLIIKEFTSISQISNTERMRRRDKLNNTKEEYKGRYILHEDYIESYYELLEEKL